MAEGIGVCTATIDKYVARGCPRTSIEAVQKWRSENIKTVSETVDQSEIALELKRAELAVLLENARAKKQKNDLLAERLRDVEEVNHSNVILYSRITRRLQSLGMQCANVVASEFKAVIKQQVEDVVRIVMKEIENEVCSLH